MGGSEPPYLYDRPQHTRNSVAYPYSHFNPKAVSEASYAAVSTATLPRPQHNGPLINFNQHPDSYMIVTGQNVDFQPMSANTKKTVTILRWVQFALRVLEELGALGLLVATICIRGTQGAVTYLLRIPPAWDAVITLYALLHLIRPAKARTPASSCSYHCFALFMDVGLIPFYVFIAILSENEYGEALGTTGRWRSFFPDADTTLILTAIWIGAAAIGGLHLISAGFDVALIVIFRKMANLPPDMNPLEENLTGRRTIFNPRHKHKNSEYTLQSEDSMTEAEKTMAHMSGSTLSVPNPSRISVADKDSTDEDRRIPFRHSRTGSTTDLSFSPHNPESARWSRHQYDGQQNIYREAAASEKSRYQIGPEGKLQVRTRAHRGSRSPTKHQHARTPTLPNIPDAPNTTHQSSASDLHQAAPDQFTPAPTHRGARTQQEQGLLNDNWYVTEGDDEGSDLGSPNRGGRNGYQPVHDRHDSAFEPNSAEVRSEQVYPPPKPLGMNPPTPPPQADEQYPDPDEVRGEAGVSRTPTAASQATITSSVYSESAPSLQTSSKFPTMTSSATSTPKGKYYGNLAAATRGVRGASPPVRHQQYPPSPTRSPAPSPDRTQYGNTGRVISRSGVDIASAEMVGGDTLDEGPYATHFHPQRGGYGIRSRREVSGKVAEEGRGGSGVQRTDWAGGRIFR